MPATVDRRGCRVADAAKGQGGRSPFPEDMGSISHPAPTARSVLNGKVFKSSDSTT